MATIGVFNHLLSFRCCAVLLPEDPLVLLVTSASPETKMEGDALSLVRNSTGVGAGECS